ncbi:cbb3-type cytochrome c oxidase subunit I [Egicoccus sp. AB-alg2]|uniref:cbb3-type cytochrome c oxidase subunit I n=1 Tax=Egicoccus sp. AB-alg2 TaxID=3242693 RepID=UPI00359CEE31
MSSTTGTGGAHTPATPEDVELLDQVWASKPGFLGWVGQCNHKAVGRRFVFTAFFFLLLGGALAMVMRLQLIQPDNDVVGPDGFNQLFTMHGTIMMFLFVVPMLKGFTIYVAPLQLGARDMPMPRVNAFSYWAYLAAGLFLLSSFVAGAIPDGGWFAYVPLTGPEFSPGLGLDFWLLGVTLLEVSAIAGATEIVTLVARFRAQGMSLGRVPVFVWSSLVAAVMILFAFPPLVAGTILLELDRKIGTRFFDATGGGDPLLWQHLFWWFGHPEVYIQLIPAVGMAAAIVTVAAGRRLAGRTAYIAATVSIGILSFGLWVHHMYATGIPLLGTSLFMAASMMIAIPSGVVIMCFIGTLWWGRIRWSSAMLYVVGFVFVFVAGGITGVMVAMVPFDLQAHDTYFVVAHFHYVLIGGSLFPILAAMHFWLPKLTGRMMHEGAGKVAFALNFVGFNVAFFLQHWLGLVGMPRRIWTYEAGLGWDGWNLVSSLGSFVMGLGMLVFALNLLWAHRRGAPTAPDDPWGGDTLEWATTSPAPNYNFLGTMRVASPEPMWDGESVVGLPGDPDVEVPDWQARLDIPRERLRETLATTGLDAHPDHIISLPGHSFWPVWLTLALVIGLTGVLVDGVSLGLAGLGAIIVATTAWLWPGVE